MRERERGHTCRQVLVTKANNKSQLTALTLEQNSMIKETTCHWLSMKHIKPFYSWATSPLKHKNKTHKGKEGSETERWGCGKKRR